MADAAQRTKPEATSQTIVKVEPGMTVVELKSGVRIAGQLLPKSVKRRSNEVDPATGKPVFDVEWHVVTKTLAEEDPQ